MTGNSPQTRRTQTPRAPAIRNPKAAESLLLQVCVDGSATDRDHLYRILAIVLKPTGGRFCV